MLYVVFKKRKKRRRRVGPASVICVLHAYIYNVYSLACRRGRIRPRAVRSSCAAGRSERSLGSGSPLILSEKYYDFE